MKKKALVTGITGQDGAYLAELLIGKGYEVHGVRRRASLLNTERIDQLITEPQVTDGDLYLHYGDLTDTSGMTRLVQQVQPDEIYNLAAQSHVHVSFDTPEYTANTDALGTLRLLESIRILGLEDKTKFYQASTSELYGKIQDPIQTENTPFYPRSPYAVAKLYAYWITINYREAYGLYACNGILFNHESPKRGDSFVTRKITRAISRILVGLQDLLYMGNIDAQRDWGHAKDYVEMQWLMLQQEVADDYVIATGKKYTVRQFIDFACDEVGISLRWEGAGVEEVGYVDVIDSHLVESILGGNLCAIKEGDALVKIDPYYFRPTEVDILIGDASKAKEKLGWEPKITVKEMVSEMVSGDLTLALRDLHLSKGGFKAATSPSVD